LTTARAEEEEFLLTKMRMFGMKDKKRSIALTRTSKIITKTKTQR